MIPVEPYYDPKNLNSHGAELNWIAMMSRGNPTGGYIDLDGNAYITNGDNVGQWVDADAEHPVPPEWTAKYPDIQNPQYWKPGNPDLENNTVYKFVTAWGRDGFGITVPGPEALAAVAASRANPVEPPAPYFPKPTVPPHLSPSHLFAQFESYLRRFARWL